MKTRALLFATILTSLAALTHLNALTITGPTNQVVSLGANVTLAVTATSTNPPITYQWWGKGALLPDQTNRTCVLTNVQLDQAGEYYVVVSDATPESVQSDTATVNVDSTFIKIIEGPIVTELDASQGARWWDYDNDGWLDLFVNHVTMASSGVLPSLFHNEGDGTFTKVTTNALVQARKRSVVSAVGDFDNKGDEDIYYSGNAHPSSTEPKCDLFRNDGNGRFTRVRGPRQQDLDLTIDCTFVDYDRDGLLDVYAVNGHKQPACLYHQTPQGTFVKMTAAQVGSILGAMPECYNAAWADCDNDSFLDLFLGCGEPGEPEPDHLYRNNALGVGNANHWLKIKLNPEVLYQNHGNGNHWISFKLVGTRSNRSAIGAKVRVQVTILGNTYWQMREIDGGNRSQNDLRPHFGLGDSVRATAVRVEWPSGVSETFSNLARDQFYTIVEPSLRGTMQPNGEFEVTAMASTNRVCQLDVSTNLLDWTTLTNFSGMGETPVKITDAEAPGQSRRFYQLK